MMAVFDDTCGNLIQIVQMKGRAQDNVIGTDATMGVVGLWHLMMK